MRGWDHQASLEERGEGGCGERHEAWCVLYYLTSLQLLLFLLPPPVQPAEPTLWLSPSLSVLPVILSHLHSLTLRFSAKH